MKNILKIISLTILLNSVALANTYRTIKCIKQDKQEYIIITSDRESKIYTNFTSNVPNAIILKPEDFEHLKHEFEL